MFSVAELSSCPRLLLAVHVLLFGLSGVFSSFDIALFGLLRDYAGLSLFPLVRQLLVGTFFVEFSEFWPFRPCCAIRCRSISLEGFPVLWTIYANPLFPRRWLSVSFCCFIKVENF